MYLGYKYLLIKEILLEVQCYNDSKRLNVPE